MAISILFRENEVAVIQPAINRGRKEEPTFLISCSAGIKNRECGRNIFHVLLVLGQTPIHYTGTSLSKVKNTRGLKRTWTLVFCSRVGGEAAVSRQFLGSYIQRFDGS